MSSFGYSQGFIIISHILFSMFEINIYSIINFKVIGVKIGVNFLLAIVKYRLNDCKHVAKVKMMQLCKTNGKNENCCIDRTNQ